MYIALQVSFAIHPCLLVAIYLCICNACQNLDHILHAWYIYICI